MLTALLRETLQEGPAGAAGLSDAMGLHSALRGVGAGGVPSTASAGSAAVAAAAAAGGGNAAGLSGSSAPFDPFTAAAAASFDAPWCVARRC